MSAHVIETPFSNGTEAVAWQATWCDRCLHDHYVHTDAGALAIDRGELDVNRGGCPLFMRAFFHISTPTVWQLYEAEPPFHLPTTMRCAGFEPCEHCDQPVDLRPPVYGEVYP